MLAVFRIAILWKAEIIIIIWRRKKRSPAVSFHRSSSTPNPGKEKKRLSLADSFHGDQTLEKIIKKKGKKKKKKRKKKKKKKKKKITA